MKLTRDQFRQLQRLWYDELENNGFEDIEELNGKGELVFKQRQDGLLRNHTLDSMRNQEEYYRFIGHMVNDHETKYKSEIDRFILVRHSEGAYHQTIVEELRVKGTPRHRETIRTTIRRYLLVWRIKVS